MAVSIKINTQNSEYGELAVWYDQFYQHLCSLGLRFGYPREDVKDLINQCFLSLIEKKIKPDLIENPKGYLSVIFSRLLIDHNRSVVKKQKATAGLEDGYEPCIQETYEVLQTNAEMIHRLREAYQQLPARCQKVIFLKFYEGLTTEQIVERTGLSSRSVYNNLFEGIRALRSSFKESKPVLHVNAFPDLMLFALLAAAAENFL